MSFGRFVKRAVDAIIGSMPIIVLAGSYILGAIPCAVLVARSRGVDIRSVGSSNPGAHNVMRQVGQFWGWLVAAFDFFKGVLPVVVARAMGLNEWWQLGAGSAAMLGHITSPFLNFRGGKGQSTGFGMLIALYPIGSFIGIVIGLSFLGFTRIVVLAAFIAAFVTFVIALSQSQPIAIIISPWVVIGLGLFATLPGAITLIRTQGGIGPALRSWRGGKGVTR
jgi:acyl phosphate:glycerol-3-phosphate acyltransferase